IRIRYGSRWSTWSTTRPITVDRSQHCCDSSPNPWTRISWCITTREISRGDHIRTHLRDRLKRKINKKNVIPRRARLAGQVEGPLCLLVARLCSVGTSVIRTRCLTASEEERGTSW